MEVAIVVNIVTSEGEVRNPTPYTYRGTDEVKLQVGDFVLIPMGGRKVTCKVIKFEVGEEADKVFTKLENDMYKPFPRYKLTLLRPDDIESFVPESREEEPED